MSPIKRKLVDGKINCHFGGQLKQRQKTQMELYLLRGKANANAKIKTKTHVDPRTLDSWFGGTGSTTGTVTPKSSLSSARAYPMLDDEEVMLVKVKTSPPKQNGKPPSFRQEAEAESKQRSLSDEENIPTRQNQNTTSIPTTATAHIPAVAAPMSPPRASQSVIDLTDDSAHPSPASVPLPPSPTYYTLAEFNSMWDMAEKDGKYSIEEIEKGSLVRSGNSKVEVRGNTDTVDVCA
jgi:hypothetical protein